ncbi:MAG: N-acetylmuramoyl-L-alanine amidase [Desulfuromonadales bacterium]|nr:N-acetylmuramoyl-L-alanine amidase [Desulfuromonadales bacterium]
MSKAFTVMIDPGHGGADPGATANHPVEAAINLAVARRLREVLEAEGHAVVLTRHADVTRSLGERVRLEHQERPDLFLSLHCNAAANVAASGIEVWTSPGDSPADPAATAIFRAVCQAFPERRVRTDYSDGDPDKEARFHVLVKTLGPAVLLEMGFVTNDEERAWLLKPSVQRRMAMAIAAGILAWSIDDHHARIDQIRASHGEPRC